MSLQLNPSFGSYGVVVSISGCDPLDPGSTPGTAKVFADALLFSVHFLWFNAVSPTLFEFWFVGAPMVYR